MISVVIPVGQVDQRLFEQLDALACQVSAPPFEVMLSANTSASYAALLQHKTPLPVRLVDSSDCAGPSHARNEGWRASSHQVVLFCDADDVVGDHWVAEMSSLSERFDIFGGPLDYDQLNQPGVGKWIHNWGQGMPHKFDSLPFLPSANLGFRRPLLEQLDGWDVRLTASEDTDLCWRAQVAGYTVGYSQNAVVHYRLRRGWAAITRQHFAYGRSDVEFARRWNIKTRRLSAASQLLKIIAFCGAAILDESRRPVAMAKLANLAGRVAASVRMRWWCV